MKSLIAVLESEAATYSGADRKSWPALRVGLSKLQASLPTLAKTKRPIQNQFDTMLIVKKNADFADPETELAIGIVERKSGSVKLQKKIERTEGATVESILAKATELAKSMTSGEIMNAFLDKQEKAVADKDQARKDRISNREAEAALGKGERGRPA